jgi:excisionase family DNA binding protein
MTVQYRCGQRNELSLVWFILKKLSADERQEIDSWFSLADKVVNFDYMGVITISNTNMEIYKKSVPIWEKYMLTVDEAAQYFGIGEKKIRMLIAENTNTDFCFTVQIGNKSLINRHKFEDFLNHTTAL